MNTSYAELSQLITVRANELLSTFKEDSLGLALQLSTEYEGKVIGIENQNSKSSIKVNDKERMYHCVMVLSLDEEYTELRVYDPYTEKYNIPYLDYLEMLQQNNTCIKVKQLSSGY